MTTDTTKAALTDLPECYITSGGREFYSADQMREYAQAALLRANAAVVPSLTEEQWQAVSDRTNYIIPGFLKEAVADVLAAAPSAPVLAEPQETMFAVNIAQRKWSELHTDGHRMTLIHFEGGSAGPGTIDPWGVVRWTQQPVQGGGDAWINDVLLAVAELPDRNSPEDQPEMMLVSADELRDILGENAPALALPPAQPAPQAQGVDWHAIALRLDEAHDESLDGRHGVAREILREVTASLRATPPSPVAQPEALPVHSPNYVPADLQAMNARQAQTIKDLKRELEARASLPTSGVPILFVSPGQLRDAVAGTLQGFRSLPEGTGGYLPVRTAAGGLFTTPLYAAPQPAAARVGLSQRVCCSDCPRDVVVCKKCESMGIDADDVEQYGNDRSREGDQQ